MATLNKIASFAVLDLETTGLPDHNFNKANITEIAIHGIAAEDIRKAETCDTPRIIHKLTLVFNPRMMIHPDSEKITGLNNYILEEESTFDANAASVIINFLKHLKQPVCLVAHNGDGFDFRVLKHSFDKLGMDLPSDVVCIDTLVAIKELDKLAEEREEICFSQEDDFITPLSGVENIPLTPTSELEQEKETVDWQKMNETTPKRPPNALADRRKRKKHKEDGEADRNIKSRRSLFKSPDEVKSTPSRVGQYKLGNIHLRLFNEDPQITHQAEADVAILERVMLYYGKSFVEYAEANAKPFGDVKKVGAR